MNKTLKQVIEEHGLPLEVEEDGRIIKLMFTHRNSAYGYCTQSLQSVRMLFNTLEVRVHTPKVKRAQYLIYRKETIPFQTANFYLDEAELRKDQFIHKDETIVRLTETEREFDE